MKQQYLLSFVVFFLNSATSIIVNPTEPWLRKNTKKVFVSYLGNFKSSYSTKLSKTLLYRHRIVFFCAFGFGERKGRVF